VTKVADQSVVTVGGQAGFTVTLRNVGAGAAFDVSLSDPLPAGVAWSIDGPADGFTLVGGTLSFSAAALASGEVHRVHVIGAPDAADAGVLSNPATASASNEPAAALGNNSGTDRITVVAPAPTPDLVVIKSPDRPVASAGEQAGFTVTLRNVGG